MWNERNFNPVCVFKNTKWFQRYLENILNKLEQRQSQTPFSSAIWIQYNISIKFLSKKFVSIKYKVNKCCVMFTFFGPKWFWVKIFVFQNNFSWVIKNHVSKNIKGKNIFWVQTNVDQKTTALKKRFKSKFGSNNPNQKIVGYKRILVKKNVG